MEAKIVDTYTLFSGPVSYRIPQFQRPYAWREDSQWMPLWEDVRSVAERQLKRGVNDRVKPHFLGAIVLQHRKSSTGEVIKRLVVDGQQRLTTLQLLIKAAQQVFQQFNYTDRVTRLQILTENHESHWGNDSDNETKIRQSNRNDQKAFQEAIRVTFLDADGNYWPITTAFKFFKEKVDAWLEDGDDISIRADALEETLTKHLQIAVIDLDEDEEPHVIFETLNTRGEPLKQSDLVKNTVMYEADVVDEAKEADRLWGMFEDEWWRRSTGERGLDRINVDRFLNQWMIVRTRSNVAPNRVAADFRNFLSDKNTRDTLTNVHAVAEDIKNMGVIYKRMVEFRDPDTETFLRRMRAMNVSVGMPVLLWLRTLGMPKNHFDRCVEILESYLVRRMLCGLPVQGLHGYFIGLLDKLHEVRDVNYYGTIANYLENPTSSAFVWPSNRMVLEQLTQAPMGGTVARRKMALEAIEINLRSDKAELLGATDKLTIEHIMPQRWEAYWPLSPDKSNQANVDVRNGLVKHFGNLTLVTGKLNTSLSNAPWDDKQKTLYKHSSLFLNKELLNAYSNRWDEDTIRERSKRLAEITTRIWKPSEYFATTLL